MKQMKEKFRGTSNLKQSDIWRNVELEIFLQNEEQVSYEKLENSSIV